MKKKLRVSTVFVGAGACMAAGFGAPAYAAPNGITLNTGQIKNLENGYCLNGALVTSHAEVTMTPCNTTDKHMMWGVYSTLLGGGYELIDKANNDCLNGYTGTAHAEVTVTPCNSNDKHMRWFSASRSGHWTWQNSANSDCLNGYIGTAHAEVTMTPCNSGDHHMDWTGVKA